MNWITTRHIQSTDGKTEQISCELKLNVPPAPWNKKKDRTVLSLYFYDYKIEGGWWIDNDKTKWYVYPPHKFCEIKTNYFQSHPEIKIYSSDRENKINYNDFTIDYCKEQSILIFKERLYNILNQLG